MNSENMESRLTLRVSNQDLNDLRTLAKRERLTMSAYVRKTISTNLNSIQDEK